MRSKIFSEIEKNNSILLLTHENPDGDAIGSVLAFYNYLKSINKLVDMVILDIPKIFDFLPSINKVVDTVDKEYDLGIVVDCATAKRVGQKNDLLSKCKKLICIDHHVSNELYGDINLVLGNVSSCSQVIYYLFKDWDITFTKEICESIISGVITDTNGFKVNNVDSDTFKLAAEIFDLGVDIHTIYDTLLCKKSMPQYNLMRIAMDRLEFFNNNKIAYTYVLRKDFEDVHALLGDHEGIVDIGRSINGVEVSLFIREIDDNLWTISLRSTGNVDVNKVASAIGGGGHFMAAGGKALGTLSEVKETLINEIKKVV